MWILRLFFYIPNHGEFNLQWFQIFLLPDANADVPHSGRIQVLTKLMEFDVRDDDCKLILLSFSHLAKQEYL